MNEINQIKALLKRGQLLSTHAVTKVEWYERSDAQLCYNAKVIRKMVFMNSMRPDIPLFILDLPLLIDINIDTPMTPKGFKVSYTIKDFEKNGFNIYSPNKHPVRTSQLDQDFLYDFARNTFDLTFANEHPFASNEELMDFIVSHQIYLEVLDAEGSFSIPSKSWLECNLEINLNELFKHQTPNYMVC